MPTKTTPATDQPDPSDLLGQITALVRSLDQVVARTTSGGIPPSATDPDRVRRQAVARLRYDIISGLLGRAGFVPPFAPARRGATNRIVFEPPLPETARLVLLRSAGPGGETQAVALFEQTQETTVIDTGLVGEDPLQPIEIYDGNGILIRLGPNLAARGSSAGAAGRQTAH